MYFLKNLLFFLIQRTKLPHLPGENYRELKTKLYQAGNMLAKIRNNNCQD